MLRSFLCSAMVLLFSSSLVADQRHTTDARQVKTCSAISLARPGFGVAYRGTVENDDYGLRMVVPRGLIGWGAASVAPFHGFTMFLSEKDRSVSCIEFEIHLRVDLGDDEDHGQNHDVVKVVKLGNINGKQQDRIGDAGGTTLKNILITFSVPRGSDIEDGSVWLITPMKYLQKNLPIFDRFISGITFREDQR